MTFQEINDLIEKYFAGETSLAEEKILRGYFNSLKVDARLATYAPLFQFFEKEKTIVLGDAKMPKFQEVKTLEASKQPFTFKILRNEIPILSGLRGGNFWKIAATVAFVVVGSVAIFKTFEPKPNPQGFVTGPKKKARMIILDETTNPDSALIQVNAALALVSKKMKKGTDETTSGLLKLRDATSVLNN